MKHYSKSNFKWTSIILALTLFGCDGGTSLPIGNSTESSTDTDGDGLSDILETDTYGTSPVIADTDGDGYSDGDEVLQLGVGNSNPYVYNPLVADLPQLKVEVTSIPNIGYDFSDSSGTSRQGSTTRSQTQSTSTSTTFGASVTVGVEATAEVSGSITGPSASASVTASMESTVSFETTATNENQNTYSNMLSEGVDQNTTWNGGTVNVTVKISNPGHIAYTLKGLSLSSTKAADGQDPFLPLATLNYKGNFPQQSLSGGDERTDLIFENTELTLQNTRTMLTEARSLTVKPATFEITDSTDTAFAFTQEEVDAKTAKILIDYGPYAESELFYVATNSDPNNPGRKLNEVLSDILAIPFTESNGIDTVRSLPSSSAGTDRWVITKRQNQGQGGIEKIFDANEASYAISNISVNVGDEILMVYLQDADGDGLGYREELVHGTNPNDADTDNDGLSDFEEVRESWVVSAINQIDANRYPAKVFSSPISADYDGDNVSDANEKARGLDPYNRDTDGDSIDDNTDFSTAGAPLTNNTKVERINTTTVRVSGSVSANAPQTLESVNLNWGNGNSESWNGGVSRSLNPQDQVFVAPGTYTISLDITDDSTPTAHTLNHTAEVVLTESTKIATGYSWDAGFRVTKHVRTVADLNQDGFDDVIVIGDTKTSVFLGSSSGPQAATDWSSEWKKSTFGRVETEPRFFIDIDNDGDLDIVGIDKTTDSVRYGLNSGTAFADPVEWISNINWNSSYDTAYIVDVDNNNYPDFVHAKRNGNLTVYTSNGSGLGHSIAIVDPIVWEAGYPNRTLYPIEAADMDADGCTDLVLFGTNNTFVNRAQCDGTWGGWTVLITSGLDYGSNWRTTIHHRELTDLNNDGLPDVIGFGGNHVFVYINQSTVGNIDVSNHEVWASQFVSSQGWAMEKTVSGRLVYNIHPRYLADVNGDGFKDIIGYAGAGAYIAINNLGVDNTNGFATYYYAAPDFDINDSSWWENHNSNSVKTGCNSTKPCREYFPRMVGDFNGDGHTDLLGFDQTGMVYQPSTYVTQFK